jgi:hypothetical protein
MAEQDLFGATIKEMAAGPHIGGHAALTKALMERLSEKGLPLEHLTDPKMMKRSRRTLEAHAREYGIAFPDYVPMALRKQLAFVQRGDFFELVGDEVDKVAEILGMVVTVKDVHYAMQFLHEELVRVPVNFSKSRYYLHPSGKPVPAGVANEARAHGRAAYVWSEAA